MRRKKLYFILIPIVIIIFVIFTYKIFKVSKIIETTSTPNVCSSLNEEMCEKSGCRSIREQKGPHRDDVGMPLYNLVFVRCEPHADIVISTDKTEYSQGEIIKITVNNKFHSPVLYPFVLYSSGGDRFWGLEHFINDKWTNPAFEKGGGFQLPEKNIGDICLIKLYEKSPLSEFKLGATLFSSWNQKICPFGTTSPTEPKIVRYMESGQYRFTFTYSYPTSDDGFSPGPSSPKTVYSNSFIIK